MLRSQGTGGSATVTSSTYASGTQCLSLVFNLMNGGGYLRLPSFTMGGDCWAICCWIKIASIPKGGYYTLFHFDNNHSKSIELSVNDTGKISSIKMTRIYIYSNI